MKTQVTLCLALATICGLSIDVPLRGPSETEVGVKPWTVETLVEYDGVYTLRKSEAPSDMVVVNSFNDDKGNEHLSIMKIEKGFPGAEPVYTNLGTYTADPKTGKFHRSYPPVEIKAVKFPITVAEGKSVEAVGLSLDGILFKRVFNH